MATIYNSDPKENERRLKDINEVLDFMKVICIVMIPGLIFSVIFASIASYYQ